MDHSITPTHQPPRRSADDAFTRVTGGITRWALGWGFLSLHATVFTIAMIVMVLWNIYDTPNDIWVDGVFRRWGVVLAFHAIAVAAGLTAWRLIKAEQQALMVEPPQWTPSQSRPTPSLPVQSIPVTVPAAEWAPYAQEPVTPVPSRSRQYLATLQRADAVFGRALAASAAWTGVAAQRTGQAASTGIAQLLARVRKSDATTAPDPAYTWPPSSDRHRPEDEEFISRFAGNGVAGTNGNNPAAGGARSGGDDIVLDASGFSPDDHWRPGAPPVMKDPSQSWVQAATYTWNVPHESQPGMTPAAQNGHTEPPAGMATSAPESTPPAADD